MIGCDRLHGSVTGKGVKIALVDTGLDASHPALAGKIGEQADMTGKGFTADLHATMIAGIMVSEPGRKSKGITGVAPGAEILAIKACQPLSPKTVAAQCWSLTLGKGLDFAIEKKAGVINMSLGGPPGTEDKLLKRMVDEAVNRGLPVVAAAGNDGPKAKAGLPAALPNVIAVTAIDANQQLYTRATRGDFVDLAAPGVEIISTSPGGKLSVASGTSMATAFVSATAALLLQVQPRLSPQSLRELLERTAKNLGHPGKDPEFGRGLVNACGAVAELKHDARLCR
jgi:subtilisin family serine protease